MKDSFQDPIRVPVGTYSAAEAGLFRAPAPCLIPDTLKGPKAFFNEGHLRGLFSKDFCKSFLMKIIPVMGSFFKGFV